MRKSEIAVIGKWFADLWRGVSTRFDRSPIGSVESLTGFVGTRSAYVAQTALYGYLRTRMGTQYREIFQDEAYSVSMRQSAAQLFVSCLGDLTVFAVATAAAEGRLTQEQAAALAEQCFETGARRTLTESNTTVSIEEAVAAFRDRAGKTRWPDAAVGDAAFVNSPDDLVRFAPVIDEFKDLDREIVTNSIKFKWRDVREQFRKRVDPEGIRQDLLARAAA